MKLLNEVWWHWLLVAFLVGLGWHTAGALVAAWTGWWAAWSTRTHSDRRNP